MKTIAIKEDIKSDLEKYGDGKSINKSMRELLDDAETKKLPQNSSSKETLRNVNIGIDDDLLLRLKRFKSHPSENYSSVISRLIKECEED